jgi:hypothetical protein
MSHLGGSLTVPNVVHTRPTSLVPAVLSSITAALGTLGIGLLVAGSAVNNHALLSWGVVLGVGTVGLGVVTAVRLMVDDAVNRCVNRVYTVLQAEVEEAVANTAVKVGQAIAESLADNDDPHPPSPRAGVHQLY